jgi:hypothetical protein
VGQVLIDQVPFKHDLSGAELKDVLSGINAARASTKSRSRLLLEAHIGGDKPGQKKLIESLLYGEDARLVSVIRANQKLPAKKRHPLERCLSVGQSLDLSKPLKEPVEVWLKNKTNGYRIIHNHGLKHRTAQDLLKRVMDRVFVPRPFQYTHLGIHAAIKQTKALINAGYVHAAHLDVKDFYGSFELEKLLPELPLPKEVVEHAVVGRLMETVWDQEHMKGKLHPSLSPHYILHKEARLGIPQGSACSSIIGAYCMARLQWVPVADVVLLNYADDFLLLAKSSNAQAKAIDELTEAVGSLPGGKFKLNQKQKGNAAYGITFLGHTLQLMDGLLATWPWDGGAGLYRELGKIDILLGKTVYPGGGFCKFDKQEALRLLAKCYAMVDGWRAAFKECDQVDRLLWTALHNIVDSLNKIGATQADLEKAVTPDMEYHLDPYALGK